MNTEKRALQCEREVIAKEMEQLQLAAEKYFH
jgi:hypothetical protein